MFFASIGFSQDSQENARLRTCLSRMQRGLPVRGDFQAKGILDILRTGDPDSQLLALQTVRALNLHGRPDAVSSEIERIARTSRSEITRAAALELIPTLEHQDGGLEPLLGLFLEASQDSSVLVREVAILWLSETARNFVNPALSDSEQDEIFQSLLDGLARVIDVETNPDLITEILGAFNFNAQIMREHQIEVIESRLERGGFPPENEGAARALLERIQYLEDGDPDLIGPWD